MEVLSIVDVLVLGFAAFWIWWVVARMSPPFLMWALRPLRRRPAVRKFLACPWCSGAWWAIAVVLVFVALAVPMGVMTWTDVVLWAPFTALGASAVVGLTGTLIPDDGEPFDEGN